MAGEQRRHLALDRLDRVTGVGAGQHEEHAGDTVERAAALLQRRDGVVEARRGGIGGDRVDLGAVRGQRRIEGGTELVGRDGGEGRQAERAVQSASSGFRVSGPDCGCVMRPI